ncbi:MAG TPA: BamA/TamA family outer membrane protein [Cyclobacteriaceae bacterium]|nr:BamA/TamA family outer membrane protein [Cyclobacteriaceae bacterium]
MRLLTCVLILTTVTSVAQKKRDKFVLFPVIVKSPEYRWGGGAAGTFFFKIGKDSFARTSSFKAVSFFTLRKQLVAATEGNIYFPNEKYILYVVSSATRFPDKFWGLGNTSQPEALENYSISQYSIFPKLMRRIFSRFYGGVGYEFQNVFRFEYDRSGTSVFDKEDIVGRNGGFVSGPGATITWDSRNHAFAPSKGFYVQFYAGIYRQQLGSSFDFAVRNLDVRKYFALSKTTVLAFQANLISTVGHVPIRQLTNIGSNTYMRGYYEGRYTDKNLIAIQSELRFPVYKRFGMVTFAGLGRVGNALKDIFTPSHLKPSIGAGIRFALSPQEKLHLRVDAGFGNKSNGTYLNMGEAF